jgi:hypothetical protein
MGQQIVIDHRDGAVQTIGTRIVVCSNPDGYMIGYANVVTLSTRTVLIFVRNRISNTPASQGSCERPDRLDARGVMI